MNEDATEKLLRELKEENERLKKMMVGGKVDMTDFIDDNSDGLDDRVGKQTRVTLPQHTNL